MSALVLQIAGMLFLVAGAFMVHPALGCAVAGGGLMAFGLAAERRA